jgi:hypothetical protein
MSEAVGLIEIVLRDTPKLSGAKCVGQHRIFTEPETDADVQDAIDLCLYACPALADCERWYRSLPLRRRPEGVTAGKFYKRREYKRKGAA